MSEKYLLKDDDLIESEPRSSITRPRDLSWVNSLFSCDFVTIVPAL